MQYLYEKLQRHNLVTTMVVGTTAYRPHLGFRYSCSKSGRVCEFLRKANGVSDEGLQ
jgi:hypothetical protein